MLDKEARQFLIGQESDLDRIYKKALFNLSDVEDRLGVILPGEYGEEAAGLAQRELEKSFILRHPWLK